MKRVAAPIISLVLAIHAGCGIPSGAGGADADEIATSGPAPVSGSGEPQDASSNGSVSPPANVNDNGADDTAGDENAGQTNDNADDFFPAGPPADACEAVAGRTFEIAGRTLAFSGNRFSWITSGGQIIGTFICEGFDLLGISPENEPFVGSYDALTGSVTWQGTIYLPEH